MEEKKESRGTVFIRHALERMSKDTAFGAALKRADNAATEYQSWEYLAAYRVDLEKPFERIPFAYIAAAVARAKPAHDGSLGLGRAISRCYTNGNEDDQAKRKLRRVLACESTDETCSILRPILSLIASRGVRLNYGKLLQELLWFHYDPQKTKIGWAQDFFGKKVEE